MILLSTSKISEIHFHNTYPLCSAPSLSLSLLRCRFRRALSLVPASSSSSSCSSSSCSVRISDHGVCHSDARRPFRGRPSPSVHFDRQHNTNSTQSIRSRPPSAPWLQQWAPPDTSLSLPAPDRKPIDPAAGRGGSIERIVYRLRNLSFTSDVEEDGGDRKDAHLGGNESLGELLERSWNRPDMSSVADQILLPWERQDEVGFAEDRAGKGVKPTRRVRAPTLAELTIEDSELRRLRRLGIMLRERITVPKAGVNQALTEKIHDAWRKSEVVRLKFHEELAQDMKTAHDFVERRTGGLVLWRSGSVMVVYRGRNYQRPYRSPFSHVEGKPTEVPHESGPLCIPDVPESTQLAEDASRDISTNPDQLGPSKKSVEHDTNMTEEEIEYNTLLDGLGPRFVDWWGTGVLPVDADLLPQNIPGFKTPYRFIPTGMRSRLTNSEMTNLRKLARPLPCHFALGRNRRHHGLAAAILKLWERSLVVKIAIKRGIQNTNNKLMADELKALTGGVLLLRNKFYIVIYRGKDFIPTSVATALAEREELTKEIQDAEEQLRKSLVGETCVNALNGHAPVGTLAEFLQAQAQWGKDISAEERDAMKQEASRSEGTKLFRRIQHKLSVAQSKKIRAEKLLSKIEASMVPVDPCDDQESITDEERSVFRRIGLRMKAYLPLGIRGVFDGVIENMHLHWKHRELVKLISKQKTLSFVEDTARLLEYESGGILVAIENVPKGFAVIYYRGKNYQRPINLRPRNLLTKAKALKRAVAIQRHEGLCQHINELEETIHRLKMELGISEGVEIISDVQQKNPYEHDPCVNQVICYNLTRYTLPLF